MHKQVRNNIKTNKQQNNTIKKQNTCGSPEWTFYKKKKKNADFQQAHEEMFNIINYQRYANKTMCYHFIHVRMDITERGTNIKCW